MAKIQYRKKKLVFILSTWGDSHQLNRMLMIEKKQMNIISLAYERDYYPSKVNRPHVYLGKLRHGNYLGRVVSYFKSAIVVRREIKRNGPLVYVFGLDNLIQLYIIKRFFAKGTVIFYEISDIRSIETGNSMFSRLLRRVYRQALHSVDELIVTSPEFVTEYLVKLVSFNPRNYIILENKVHSSMVRSVSHQGDCNRSKSADKIRIGYFGLLRCNRSIEILLDLAENSGKYHIVFRGIFLGIDNALIERIKSSTAMSFHGPYLSPEDLKEMYRDIDVSWICYPYSDRNVGNWQWARTNRYYESGYFQVPMIAASGTVDAKNVDLKGLGWSIDLSRPNRAKTVLRSITLEEVRKVKEIYSKINTSDFEVTDDYEKITLRINGYNA